MERKAGLLDAEHNLQLLRFEWDLDVFSVDVRAFARRFEPIAESFQMRFSKLTSAA